MFANQQLVLFRVGHVDQLKVNGANGIKGPKELCVDQMRGLDLNF